MPEADIAASFYGALHVTDTAVNDDAEPAPAPTPAPAPAVEPAPVPSAASTTTPVVEEPEAAVSTSAEESPDALVAAKMVQNRLRYLRWLCGALIGFAAAALIVPAGPWYHFAAEPQTVMVEVPGGGFEYFETDAADMTRSGRAAGAMQPAVVLAVAAVAMSFVASRRWWFATPVILFTAFGTGRGHPPVSDLATTAGGFEVPNSSLATAQWGLDLALTLYWVTFAGIAAAGVAALIVRHSEHRLTRATTGDPTVGGVREIVSRHVVGGLARVGVMIAEAAAAERERQNNANSKGGAK